MSLNVNFQSGNLKKGAGGQPLASQQVAAGISETGQKALQGLFTRCLVKDEDGKYCNNDNDPKKKYGPKESIADKLLGLFLREQGAMGGWEDGGHMTVPHQRAGKIDVKGK